MKQVNNNEVDLLLRSLAKGRDESLRGGSASAGGNGAFSDHLDADELNSYAEGVVPVAARARYTEHLADCEACRRMVIDLSQAAGVANRLEVPQQQRIPGFWQKLAAIFSPAVLRYGVPALVLTAVIGIGLLGLQQQRRTSLVARNEQQAADTPATSGELKQAEAPTGNSSGAPPAAVAKASASPSINDSLFGKTDRAEKTTDAPAPDLSSGVFGTTTSVPKDGTPEKAAEVAQSRPYAPEPKAGAPAAAPAAVQSEADEMTRLAKEAPAKREAQGQERGRDDFRNQPVEEHGPNRSAAPQRGPYNNSQRNVGGVAVTGSGPNAENKKAEAGDKKAKADDNKARAKASDVETRYVSGRRFAREDNGWIDTAYESSQPTIKVKRGSDQFRALVADEPGLGAIADQLKGVVIVVWKNRAYRIQ